MGWPHDGLACLCSGHLPSLSKSTDRLEVGSNQELQHSITSRSFCFPTSLPPKSRDLCSTRWKTMKTWVRSVEESFLGLGDGSAV